MECAAAILEKTINQANLVEGLSVYLQSDRCFELRSHSAQNLKGNVSLYVCQICSRFASGQGLSTVRAVAEKCLSGVRGHYYLHAVQYMALKTPGSIILWNMQQRYWRRLSTRLVYV